MEKEEEEDQEPKRICCVSSLYFIFSFCLSFPPLIHNLMCAVQCNRPNHIEQRRNIDWITIPPNAIQSLIILLLSLYVRSPSTHSLSFAPNAHTTHTHIRERHQEMNVRIPFQHIFRVFSTTTSTSFDVAYYALVVYFILYALSLSFFILQFYAQLFCGHSSPLLYIDG